MPKDSPAPTTQVEAPPVDLSLLPPVLARYPRRGDELIPLLRSVQDCYGYIPAATLEPVARHLLVSRAKVLGVATFYGNFSLVPQGKHKVCVCRGTACHVRGSQHVLDCVCEELGVQPGQTTPDMQLHAADRGLCRRVRAGAGDDGGRGHTTASSTRRRPVRSSASTGRSQRHEQDSDSARPAGPQAGRRGGPAATDHRRVRHRLPGGRVGGGV